MIPDQKIVVLKERVDGHKRVKRGSGRKNGREERYGKRGSFREKEKEEIFSIYYRETGSQKMFASMIFRSVMSWTENDEQISRSDSTDLSLCSSSFLVRVNKRLPRI